MRVVSGLQSIVGQPVPRSCKEISRKIYPDCFSVSLGGLCPRALLFSLFNLKFNT
jgi:hypothetical protein